MSTQARSQQICVAASANHGSLPPVASTTQSVSGSHQQAPKTKAAARARPVEA